MRLVGVVFAAAALALPVALCAQEAEEPTFGEPIFEGGGIKVYTKADFDEGPNPFKDEGNGKVSLETAADLVAGGRSLHVQRAKPGGYFGGRTEKVAVKGTRDLHVAFCLRAKGMEAVSLNLYDALKRDNTTPTSPARTPNQAWRVVCFAVEDFHHNSDPPQKKVPANTKYTNMFFHGQENEGATGEYWIDRFIIYRGVDTQAPEPPGDVKAAVGEAGQVALTWAESKDNAFPAVYSIHRKGEGEKWVKVAESVPTRYTDRVGKAGKFTYRITAADYDNNVSEPSKDVSVTVKSVPTVEFPPPTPQQTDRAGYAANVRKIHAAGAGKVRHDVFLFAGDSITAADAYTHVLGEWLARGITVRQGVGQMQTGYGKSQIDGYLAGAKPEFAVVMYGTNDSKSPDAVKAGMDNLAYVIDACAKYGTVPIMATIPPRGFNKDQQAGEKAFSEALIKLCREKQVPVSYCFDLMIQRDLKQMLSDGVHLVPGTGNDAAGEALWLTLEQVYFALRDKSDSW